MSLVAQEVPKIGLVMEDVKVVRWLKNVGDTVKAGEVLLEVETEKSVVEIEAAASGRLSQILVQVDQSATVGDRVAWIDSVDAQEPVDARSPVGTWTPNGAGGPPEQPKIAAPAHQGPQPLTSAAAPRQTGRILSTPVARKLATERGIDLGAITGTGPGGRVQLNDVERAASPRQGAPTATSQPLSAMRRALARAMTLSNATIPQFTVTRSVDWTVLNAVRNELSAKLPKSSVKLSINDFLLQAVARSLIEFSVLNATFAGDLESDAGIVPAMGAHIGLVVAIDNGLLVPVIHNVEQLGLAEIANRRAACVERSVKGRLNSDEIAGATFSISNLGAQGPDRFTAIINPPQSAILAVGRQRDVVVARDGIAVVRSQSDLTLTVDHRVADGRQASQFLARVVDILEGRDWLS